MSGRSAYVRKKITETKGPAPPRNRAKSTTSSERDDITISDFPLPNLGKAGGATGVATTNARFLKFSEPVLREDGVYAPPKPSSASHSGSSTDGRRHNDEQGGRHNGPLEDFAYARARRPAIRTEDVSGIEKSGFRSALDKKSDEVRRGLAKTFGFGRKKAKGSDVLKTPPLGSDFRPESSATVRPGAVEEYVGCDGPEMLEGQFQPGAHNETRDPGIASPPPSSKLPPVPPPSQAPPIKRWCGNGKPVQKWNKLRKDPELWDPNGDVLIYLTHRGATPRPNASFRLSSHIIEATESRYLVTLLREGATEDSEAFGSTLPPSPVGAPPMVGSRHNHRGFPSPPVGEDAGIADADGQISYEMFFPPPGNLTKMDQVRYHVTTRNVFALLYHASLVGLSLYQALCDLHQRLESYLPVSSDSLGTIIHYLTARGLDDVRNDPEAAVALLAWSEAVDVRWDEGWREAFAHCAGLHGPRLESVADYSHISPMTRALMDRAALETQLRVQAAEERLGTFEYTDMWTPSTSHEARAAAERLQQFLKQYYIRHHGSWPPPPTSMSASIDATSSALPGGPDEDGWLTRSIAQAIQRDFGTLYDFLVNREVIFDGSEARASRKWIMMSKETRREIEADTDGIPLTDMLVEWDNRFRYPHLPHPLCMLPESTPPIAAPGTSYKKDRKGSATSSLPQGGKQTAAEKRIHYAYTQASNIDALSDVSSSLVDAFIKFEKTDRPLEVDPAVARRGRWVLIYGILQTLASVSVDAPAVRYKEGVSYHLSVRLKQGTRVPPWNKHGNKSPEVLDASHELSYCWTAPQHWNTGGDDSAASDLEGPPGSVYSGSAISRQSSMAGRAYGGGMSSQVYGGGSRTGYASSASTAGRSMRFGTTLSTYSESDTGSSIRTPSSVSNRTRSRDGRGGMRPMTGLSAVGGPSSAFGGGFPGSGLPGIGAGHGMGYNSSIDRLDEEWPARDQNMAIGMANDLTVSQPRSQTGSRVSSRRGSVHGGGPIERGMQVNSISGGGKHEIDMSLIIKDFDELDIVP